jgi:hypothetical protein
MLNSEMIMTLPEIQRPVLLTIKNNRIFITDKNTIQCYNLEKRKHINSIGRVGQGPGEFHEEPQIFVEDINRIFVNASFSGKVIVFNMDGKVIEEKRVSKYYDHIEPIGNDYVIQIAKFNRKKDIYEHEISLYNKNFQKRTNILSFDSINPFKKLPAMFFLTDFRVNNDSIYLLNPNEDGFKIDVFNKAEAKKYRIEKQIKKRKVPKEVIEKKTAEKKKSSGEVWPIVKKSFYVPEYYPVVQDFRVQENMIYIQTWFEKKNLIEFMIMDIRGNELKTTYLPIAEKLFAFSGDKYYYVKENFEDEIYELHSVKLEL